MENAKTIVYIEDDPEMIDLVQLILNRRGYIVKGAQGGIVGYEMVKDDVPDLVLLDLMMPDMDGWDVFHKIRDNESTRQLPVIVITAKAQAIDKVLGLRIAKVDDYICKPFTPQELIASVEKALAKTNVSS